MFRIATPHVLPAAAWYMPIAGVRCVRTERGHTAHSKMESTMLPQAQHASAISPNKIEDRLVFRQYLIQHPLRLEWVFDQLAANDIPVLRILAAELPDRYPGQIDALNQF